MSKKKPAKKKTAKKAASKPAPKKTATKKAAVKKPAAKPAAARSRARSQATPEKTAAVFITGFIPDIIQRDAPTNATAWLAWALRLRMDQSVWFAGGSTPSDLTGGKSTGAAEELMDNVENGLGVERAEGLSGKDVRAALVAVLGDGGKTGQDLADALRQVYQF